MILYLDHYDSFASILTDYIKQTGHKVHISRTDEPIDSEQLNNYSHIIIGPGPGHPRELSHLYPIINKAITESIPLLGVCLGHQLIAEYFGAEVSNASSIMHGQISKITQNECSKLYQSIPKELNVTRYHSLIINANSMPDTLLVTALTQQGEIMSFEHKAHPIYAVQYHPEAYLSEYGLAILRNFICLPQISNHL